MKVINVFFVTIFLLLAFVNCTTTDVNEFLKKVSGGTVRSAKDLEKYLEKDELKSYMKKFGFTVEQLIADPENCKADISRIILSENQSYGVALGMIACGLFIAYMGLRLFKPFMTIAGFITGGSSFYVIYQNVVNLAPALIPNTWTYASWVFVIIGGCLGSVLFLKFWNICSYILSVYGGVMVAVLVKGLIAKCEFSKYFDKTLLMVIFGILGLIFTRFIRDTLVIFTSALAGAFLIFLGLDNLKPVGFRQFLQESLTHSDDLFTKNFADEIRYNLIGVIIVTITAVIIQFKNRKSAKKEDF